MTETKYTKGPWWSNSYGTIWGNEGDTAVCHVYDAAVTAANARLIAAAPELLEAAEKVLKVLDRIDKTRERCFCNEIVLLKSAIRGSKDEEAEHRS